jgi:hypothetical protein
MTAALHATSPRLVLGPAGSPLSLLDGGWWPRSTDPEVELPELVRAIDHLHGRVWRVALGADGWSSRPRYVMVDDRRVGLGFFASQPATLLTAQCAGGRVDLLVVAPGTEEGVATEAMSAAAAPDGVRSTPQLIVADSGATRHLGRQVWATDGNHPLAAPHRSFAGGPTPDISVSAHGLAG